VTLPGASDGALRRDGSEVVRLPSDENPAGRVNGAPELSPIEELLAAEKTRADYRTRS
jgi:hypothetical protein